MDLICGDYRNRMSTEHAAILGAVHQGLLSEADIDRALRRLFTARFRLGLFDPPASVPYSRISPGDNGTETHRQLALRAAQEAIVLLKNKDNFLPLKHAPEKIAVIGPDADSLDALVGNYNGTPSQAGDDSRRPSQALSQRQNCLCRGYGPGRSGDQSDST